jgi:speckle-type POZ protein
MVPRGYVVDVWAQVDTVATTLSLAEQNHAEELKRVCLEFVSRNLQAVMVSEGYQHMVTSCPQLQVTTVAFYP